VLFRGLLRALKFSLTVVATVFFFLFLWLWCGWSRFRGFHRFLLPELLVFIHGDGSFSKADCRFEHSPEPVDLTTAAGCIL
jgi:hypothetical protein